MEEEIKEKSLQRENAESLLVVEAITPFADLDTEVKLAISCASEKKAFDIVAIDLREIASFTEFFIIASGANMRQVQAISDEITEKLKEQLNSRVIRIEEIYITDVVNLDVSATEIRRKIRAKENDWRELVPNEVAKYIEKYELYI